VANQGGPALHAPRVQPLGWASDPALPELTSFLGELSTTGYWSETTAEYGVGPLTVLPAIVQPGAPPPTLSDAELQTILTENLTGGAPTWGAPDPSTIYLHLFPPGTVVIAQGTCCKDLDGYHADLALGAVTVAYAVACACPGFDGASVDDLAQRTIVVSHELVEAATDPFVTTNPAWLYTDPDDIGWTFVTGGEVADMCALDADAYVTPAGGTHRVQRSWSNARSGALEDPCVPYPSSAAPYFDGFLDLADTVSLDGASGSFVTRGVLAKVGATRTIDVHLWSAAPTSGPWTVRAVDYEAFSGNAPNLQLTLDRDTGVSGDTLHLTIEVLSQDTSIGSAEAFLLFSDLGGRENLRVGLVGQK
jgi:hypothetical protein